MWLLPVARLVIFLAWRCINAVMHPAMPTRRNCACFCIAIENDPTTCATFRVLATLIVDIAELVFAYALALAPRMKAGAERLAIPPCEDLYKKFLHDLSRSVFATGRVTAGF